MQQRVNIFGYEMDGLSMQQAVEQLLDWTQLHNVDCNNSGGCKYVVTPNVDHTVMFQENAKLRDAYQDASLVLADGLPVVMASRWLGRKIPERVPGSDLVPALFAAADESKPLRVFLLGAGPGVAAQAAKNVEEKYPHVQVVATYSPPLGFEKDEQENENILSQIAEVQPDVLVVGLGAPKQELWVHRHHEKIEAAVALCVGATIDFLAGEKPRAPMWMRKSGLEWLHRLASEPRRLMTRYLRDAVLFPQIVWRQWIADLAGRR